MAYNADGYRILKMSEYGWSFSLELQFFRLLPRVLLVGEVTVRCCLEVDWFGQVQLLDNDTGSEVEVVTYDLDQLLRRMFGGAVSLDVNGQRLGNTDGVGELHKSSSGQTGVHQRLGNPTGSVSSRSVDLGKVLSGESTTTVSTPTTVGVDNDLSTGQTSVTLRTANDESAGWLDVVDGLVVQQFSWDCSLDDLLKDFLSQVLSGDLLGVLSRNDDGVDSQRLDRTAILEVLNSDLGLAVGSQPAQLARSSGVGKSLV